ncbi:hypothetical protein [Anabaena sp. UHCC 0451]|uniref:hypothetical protein n=1 Tax=Anabaena sp. UHCC 0451 TaxID=2055235 RepID=UPI002B206023|nr:hypothetical protein [Anabaena sp. UHCC 0451]MEA5579041.1 hypothetical protein [Anabaena sp. UHCC 0451]
MINKSVQLLLAGVMISLGILPVVAQPQQSIYDSQVAAMVEALRLAAPQTKKPNSGYYSAWQVKPETLKGWSKTCLKKELTPTQFENDPKIARQVISCIVNRELTNQFQATKNNELAAVRGAACWWMTGLYTGCDRGFTGDYVQKVVRFYQQERTKPKTVTSPASSSTGNTKK